MTGKLLHFPRRESVTPCAHPLCGSVVGPRDRVCLSPETRRVYCSADCYVLDARPKGGDLSGLLVATREAVSRLSDLLQVGEQEAVGILYLALRHRGTLERVASLIGRGVEAEKAAEIILEIDR